MFSKKTDSAPRTSRKVIVALLGLTGIAALGYNMMPEVSITTALTDMQMATGEQPHGGIFPHADEENADEPASNEPQQIFGAYKQIDDGLVAVQQTSQTFRNLIHEVFKYNTHLAQQVNKLTNGQHSKTVAVEIQTLGQIITMNNHLLIQLGGSSKVAFNELSSAMGMIGHLPTYEGPEHVATQGPLVDLITKRIVNILNDQQKHGSEVIGELERLMQNASGAHDGIVKNISGAIETVRQNTQQNNMAINNLKNLMKKNAKEMRETKAQQANSSKVVSACEGRNINEDNCIREINAFIQKDKELQKQQEDTRMGILAKYENNNKEIQQIKEQNAENSKKTESIEKNLHEVEEIKDEVAAFETNSINKVKLAQRKDAQFIHSLHKFSDIKPMLKTEVKTATELNTEINKGKLVAYCSQKEVDAIIDKWHNVMHDVKNADTVFAGLPRGCNM